ncbi:glycosyltransferase family 2 protein [Microbacter margulisiae]|uniref:Glycosyltransferase 2-like domain-containing protein n=1 Tax=Microbacter margulisiae TaxID=1350067 RepID=A0A7W5DRF9_9PORP|nr:glycosyltransferase family 2 protein [Microbacter margulisiae]MBB3187179.1 hypothetical protein [Microbacter margulisiae]
MDVSVIIVNYNTKELVMPCIRSIVTYTCDIAYEIIVVDNHSEDDSLEAIRTEFPQVKLIENDTNVGFGAANNMGMKVASGTYLLLLNSDTLIQNNAIKLFYDFYTHYAEGNIGALGTILRDKNDNIVHSSGRYPSMWRTIHDVLSGYVERGYLIRKRGQEMYCYDASTPFYMVDYITGADLFVKASVMEQFNGFDPAFFMYFEDADLQYRMGKPSGGYQRIIMKEPKIVHLEGRSDERPDFSTARRMQHETSMFYYFRKHSKYWNYLLFRILYFVIRIPIVFDSRLHTKEKRVYLQFLQSRLKV